jgi:glutamine amidotransferase
MTEVLVVRTGVANLASVLSGLRKAGADPHVSDDPAAVYDAPAVVLPGVGAFAAGMEVLTARGLAGPIAARVGSGRPLLAICLGLQLLLEASEEGPGVRGLRVVHGEAYRFREDRGVRVPQLGWNRVVPDLGCALLREGYAYFANSYRLFVPPDGYASALSDHGGFFVAAFERGPVLACQFHPELSGAWGIDLLRRWLAAAARANEDMAAEAAAHRMNPETYVNPNDVPSSNGAAKGGAC